MRGQAGSENNRQERRREEETAPSLWGTVQVAAHERNREKPEDLCSARAEMTETGSPALASRNQSMHAKTEHTALNRKLQRSPTDDTKTMSFSHEVCLVVPELEELVRLDLHLINPSNNKCFFLSDSRINE